MSGVTFSHDVEGSGLVLGESAELVEVVKGVDHVLTDLLLVDVVVAVAGNGVSGASWVVNIQKVVVIVPGEVSSLLNETFAGAVLDNSVRTALEEVSDHRTASRASLEPNDNRNLVSLDSGGEISTAVENVEESGVVVGVVDTQIAGGGVGNALDGETV